LIQNENFGFYHNARFRECYFDYKIEWVTCNLGPTAHPGRFILISQDHRFGVFLHGEPLIYDSNVPEDGLNNQFLFGNNEGNMEYVFDNVKFWNLDSP